MKVDMKFEVAIVPVSDVDRAKAFYTKLGWRVDDDIVNGDDFRAVQVTPPNSAASVTFGKGVTDAKPGSFRGGLVVSDIVAAHKHIVSSGIQATEVFHGSPFSPEARISGPDLIARAIAPTLPSRTLMVTRGSSRKSRNGRRAVNCRSSRPEAIVAFPSSHAGLGR